MLSSVVDISVGIVFFALNVMMALIYSALEVIENKDKLKSRIYKDLFFIIFLVVFGILPSLNVWNL